ncbi:tRNA (adenosine(37)-N6)-threonylcarbamoyltransferase complex dimerization subunit type 1 TsaB [Thiotrichales bacterium 19S3-7]|nr:tRNA (adenosine(37)-N6)-threonylcarbamoyltransferase complex dimerization subunit type 1 TsaB [Thiotrichales bacterium 19S3-7]MCF6801582.1 tRNA (adenosine(37)-N6)-threonylcarbamoyltransferase complex dimerization subunit type 1 TsaB [Thiotrichales bacterium 19S3-11]
MNTMKLLALDTSTDSCSVALLIGDSVYGKTILQARKHNELIIPTIDELLKEHQIGLESIDYFACGVGPGSFVGVRLGVSVIQGLAFAVDKPVIAFSSMSAVAAMVMEKEKLNCIQVGLDARMDDVYYGHYLKKDDGVIETIIERSVASNVLQLDQKTPDLVGDGFKQIALQVHKLHEAGALSLRFIMPTLLAQVKSNQVLVEVEKLQPVYLQGNKNWKQRS